MVLCILFMIYIILYFLCPKCYKRYAVFVTQLFYVIDLLLINCLTKIKSYFLTIGKLGHKEWG